MDWLEMCKQIFEVCLIPLFGVLAGVVIDAITAKRNELKSKVQNEKALKYIDMVARTINECVVATNQTYVNALKDQDLFDEDAQREAFSRTYNAVISILSQDAKLYLVEAYGDIEAYLTAKIESVVNYNK